MIRRFLAIGLASALSLTAALSGIVPGALVGSDISKVSAASESKDYTINLSYYYTQVDAKTQGQKSSNTIKVGETRKPILDAYIKTTVTDYSSSTNYVNSALEPDDINYITTYTPIAPNQLIWVSSRPAVVDVDANGVITAKAEGSARITATLYDADGTTTLDWTTASVRVSNTEEQEEVEPTVVELNVGGVYTLPDTITNPKTGVTFTGNDVSYYVVDDETDGKYEWDKENKVATGDAFTLDRTAKTLTANAYGEVQIEVWGHKYEENAYYGVYYKFYINPKVGDVVADDYGKAKYKILKASAVADEYEVAYAGMIKKTKKPVISDKVYIGNTEYDVVEIADGAFKKANITSARLPRSLRKIGASAFEASTITSLDISETQVKELGAKALFNTKKLIELTINGDVTTKFGKSAVGSLSKKVTVNIETGTNKQFKKVVVKIKNKNVGGKNAKKAKFVEF